MEKCHLIHYLTPYSIVMALLNEVCTHRIRFVKSCGLFSCFLVLGLSMGVVGPTLLDFKSQTDSPLEIVALIFPVRAAGYAFGSFLSGLLYPRMDVQIVILITMAISGSFTLVIPFLKEIYTLLLHFLFVGLSLGFFSAGKFTFERIICKDHFTCIEFN